jgi:hypothetical protein
MASSRESPAGSGSAAAGSSTSDSRRSDPRVAASPGSENASSSAATSSGRASAAPGVPVWKGPLSGTRGSLTLTLMGPLGFVSGRGVAGRAGGAFALAPASSISPKMSSDVRSPSPSPGGAVTAGLSLPLPELIGL